MQDFLHSYADDKGGDTKQANLQCAKLNTALQRLQWASRDERCAKISGCEFSGHRITGKCIASFSMGDDEQQQQQNAMPLSLESSPISTTPLTGIVNEKLATAASESIKDSRDDAEKMAKKLILGALNKVEYRNDFGRVLEYIFSVESVRKPTRDLIFWSLASPLSLQEINIQTVRWKRYFLINPMDSAARGKLEDVRNAHHLQVVGPGFSLAKTQLATLISWWLLTPQAKTVINPLLEWSLKEQYVVESTIQIINNALPYCIPYWKLCAKDAIKNALQSTELKTAARDSLMFLLKNVGEFPLGAGHENVRVNRKENHPKNANSK